MALLAAALLAIGAVVAVASAQQAPLRFSPAAVQSLDSLATLSRTARVESAACLTSYSGAPLTLEAFGPARYASADSMGLYTRGTAPLCARGVPSVHTHLVPNGLQDEPSHLDERSKRASGQPFALLLIVGERSWRVVLY